MKLWQVQEDTGKIHWCPTQLSARKLKTKLTTGTGIPRKSIKVKPVIVPTRGREELCDWLNTRDVETGMSFAADLQAVQESYTEA